MFRESETEPEVEWQKLAGRRSVIDWHYQGTLVYRLNSEMKRTAIKSCRVGGC